MKTIVAVRPYEPKGGLHFREDAFEGWRTVGGKWTNHWWYPRPFYYFIFRYSLPFHLPRHKTEAHLMFVGAPWLYFNTFADYVCYEVVPMIWDCWPYLFERVARFLEKKRVKTAIFTSSMTAELMRKRFPNMNILSVPEGIGVAPYLAGKPLKERTIDLVEFGRSNKKVLSKGFADHNIVHKYSRTGEWVFPTYKELYEGLADSKVSLTFPRCDTNPERAGNIETLTQRYWECMLSRVVMVGRAPFELVNLIGYNPVLEVKDRDAEDLVLDVVRHPDAYQELADRNREVALKYAGWDTRMETIMNFLKDCSYEM